MRTARKKSDVTAMPHAVYTAGFASRFTVFCSAVQTAEPMIVPAIASEIPFTATIASMKNSRLKPPFPV